MTALVSKIVWCLGVIGWFATRYPYARRARRVAKVRSPYRSREFVLMSISATGLGIVPALYVFTDALRFADYPIQVWQPVLGAGQSAEAEPGCPSPGGDGHLPGIPSREVPHPARLLPALWQAASRSALHRLSRSTFLLR